MLQGGTGGKRNDYQKGAARVRAKRKRGRRRRPVAFLFMKYPRHKVKDKAVETYRREENMGVLLNYRAVRQLFIPNLSQPKRTT